MSYINLDFNYFENKKSKRLKLKLGEIAELIPLRLWCYCAKHHPENGTFKEYDNEEIALIAGYMGDPKGMLDALLKFEFIEINPEGWYKIHQWEDHQGHIISFSIRGKKANKARWDKYKMDKSNTNHPSGIHEGSIMESPLLNQTKPNKQKKNIFIKPTIEDVIEYCKEKAPSVDPYHYFNSREANGWQMQNGQSIISWKHHILTWERINNKNGANNESKRRMLN